MDALLQDLADVLRCFRASGSSEYAYLPVWFESVMRRHAIRPDGYDPRFMAGLAYTGWFLFADRQLLPKFHARRAVLHLQPWEPRRWLAQQQAAPPGQRTIELRPLQKQFARIHAGQLRFELRLAEDFRATVDQVNRFQQARMGISWMEPQFVDALSQLHETPVPVANTCVRALAWELWDADQDRRVAADVGYHLGQVYASLTGYSDRRLPSMGIVQLLTQLEGMRDQGWALWDLGMPMPYKLGLGACELTGSAWLDQFHQHRLQGGPLAGFPPHDVRAGGVGQTFR